MKIQLTPRPQTLLRRLVIAAAAIALLTITPALRAADESYVAHEWGTFTSIQGGDGVLLDWNGVETGELPEFVYNWTRPGLQRTPTYGVPSAFTKVSLTSLQRMETPVIYFYPEHPMHVDVTVQFPQGQITEWFPQARDIGPSRRPADSILTALDDPARHDGVRPKPTLATLVGEQSITNSVIHWGDLELLPAKQQPELERRLPTAKKASHYFAARKTASAFVHVPPLERGVAGPEVEKFLFYRGVGNFASPLKVTVSAEEQITVANTSAAPLKHLFALKVQGGRASFAPLGNLDPTATRTTALDLTRHDLPLTEAVAQLSRRMADALESEGLYRAEAEAMVKTWRDAWFEAQGVRVLYVLPRSWTDEILPLALEPRPRELVRVMVGRSELITPGIEAQVRECVARFRQPDPGAKQAAARQFQALKLGRFATVAVRLAAMHVNDREFHTDGTALIRAAEAQATGANLSAL